MGVEEPKEGEVVRDDNTKPQVMTEAFQAQMLQIFGDGGSAYKPTEKQVDKMLALEEKGMDYTHHTHALTISALQSIVVQSRGSLGCSA